MSGQEEPCVERSQHEHPVTFKTKPNMQLTVTQSGALYLAHHRNSRRRSAPLPHLRVAGRKRSPDLLGRTLVDASFVRRLHLDNGR
jgi:hypothetical protein